MDEIQRILTARFQPLVLEIQDDSSLHAGHEGVKKSGGGHYSVLMVSKAMTGLNSLARHKEVYRSLESEMNAHKIHALKLKLHTPEEWESISHG